MSAADIVVSRNRGGPMRVLVAYGSKMGGTKGLAEMLGSDLAVFGHSVDIIPARDVKDIDGYEAVILGGALYYFVSWHKDARNLIKRHRTALQQKPVWLFSSGPLDDSATEKDIPPIRPVRKAIEQIGARGHVTFGGRLEEKNGNLPIGDWRDPEHVRSWAEKISGELAAQG
jgi:menaquinone-dependent protoporphyrinogen oxidase